MANRPNAKSAAKSQAKKINKPKAEQPKATKSHPWRFCPAGQHWVKTHPLHVPPSQKNPAGSIATRNEHCAVNPSHKDSLYADEIQEIAKQNFSSLLGPPAPNDLGFESGNSYDEYIRGWTKYWNDVFNQREPLDPDLVKALIASESSFNPDVVAKVGKTKNRARGLMQVTDETQKILGDPNGELKDQLVHVDQEDLTDPNLNICAGIRWLFRKKQIADAEAGRELSWLEAIQKYKAEKKGNKLINRVIDAYNKLKEAPK
jgi:hypothetical protein